MIDEGDIKLFNLTMDIRAGKLLMENDFTVGGKVASFLLALLTNKNHYDLFWVIDKLSLIAIGMNFHK